MSSITSGGITSTTLVCSLGMSPVDRASVKYKTKKVRLQNDLMRHSTVTWSYLSLSVCQAEQKVPALYTVSAFPRALFNALNITRAPVLFSCCIFLPRFVQYKRYPAIHTIYTFSALQKSGNLDCSVECLFGEPLQERIHESKGQQYSNTTY